jgi:hypothetical protein
MLENYAFPQPNSKNLIVPLDGEPAHFAHILLTLSGNV